MKIYSQEKSVPLTEAILFLEHNFNIKLTYTDKYINQEVYLSGFKQLPKQLNHLERQIKLKFEKISNTNIIIRPFKKTDLISICGYTKNRGFVEKKITIVTQNKKVVTTSINGFFELENIGYYEQLSFYRDGILIKQLIAKDLFKISCPTIDLKNKNTELDEVIILNYLADGIKKQEQKITINTKDFKVLSGLTEPDLIKTLQQIPNASSPFETASQVFVRGGTPDQNLVLWNGIKTYNQSHFFGLLSAFNPYVIDSLDFYYKGIPANYGGRLSSVIELKSNSNIKNKFSGNIGTNLLYSDAVLHIPLIENKLSATVSARRSFNDIWESPTYDSFSERIFQNTEINNLNNNEDRFVFSDYSFGINAKFNAKSKIQVNGIYAQNDLNFVSENIPQILTDDLKTINNGLSAKWQYLFNNKWNFQSNIGIANYLLDYSFNTLEKDTEIQKSSTKKNFINDVTSKIQFNYKPNKVHGFNVGFAHEENNIRYEFKDIEPNFSIVLDQQKDQLNSQSFFTSYRFKKRKKITLQLGIRANKYSTDSKLYVEPRIYVKAHLTKNLSVNTTYNNTSQAVTQINESVVSNLSLENLIWSTTNDDDLETLTSQQISLGAVFNKKNWFIEADSFYKETKNITTITSGFITDLSSIFSLGKQRVVGADLFIKKKIGNYNSWLSLAYLKQETLFDNFNDNQFFTSNLNINYTINWSHFYNYKNFNFALSWLWNSGKSITDSNNIITSGNPIKLSFGELNTETLPIFHRLDISALYTFKTQPKSKFKYKLGASIQNIYNRKSTINREFRTSPGIDNELLILDFNSLGITPNLSFRVLW